MAGATATVDHAYHGTLTAATVDTITVTTTDYPSIGEGIRLGTIEVFNRDAADEIYFTTDGTTVTVGGNDCYVVPKAVGASTVVSVATGPCTVQLKSTGIPKYSVIGGQP